jgi:hypothetical protein
VSLGPPVEIASVYHLGGSRSQCLLDDGGGSLVYGRTGSGFLLVQQPGKIESIRMNDLRLLVIQ